MTREHAYRLKELMHKAAVSLTDEDALEAVELFPVWAEGTEYEAGTRVRYGGVLYRCLQTHTAQAGWNPEDSVSLWAKVLIPDPEVIPEWEQPESTNPYMTGDKVRHNEHTWESTVDNNVWEPGVYGWDIIEGEV